MFLCHDLIPKLLVSPIQVEKSDIQHVQKFHNTVFCVLALTILPIVYDLYKVSQIMFAQQRRRQLGIIANLISILIP